MRVILDDGAYKPERAYDTDAGFDLRTPEAFDVAPAGPKGAGVAVIDTGVHMEIPPGYFGSIRSKSGLNVRLGLTTDGVVDSGYTGSITVKLYNHSGKRRAFEAGDKIAQIIIQPFIAPEIEIVDSLPETERNTGGFGSTGR